MITAVEERPEGTALALSIGSINIPSKVGRDDWVACWEKTAERTTVFGSQECFTPGQRRAYRRMCRKHKWKVRGMGASPNPVFWDEDVWEYVSHRVILLHNESGRKTNPGFNAERYMTEVVLRHKKLGVELAVLNTHWVAPFHVSRLFLTKSRRASKKKARQRIRVHKAAGRIVVFMGDTNIGRKISLAGIKWIRGKGIDKIGIAVPKGWTIDMAAHVIFKAPTDHGHGVQGLARVTAA